jgi:glutamine synthetase type III
VPTTLLSSLPSKVVGVSVVVERVTAPVTLNVLDKVAAPVTPSVPLTSRVYDGESFIIPTLEKHMNQLGQAHEAMTSAVLKKYHKARVTEFENVFADVLTSFETFKAKVEKSRKGQDEHKRMMDIVKDLQPASFVLRDAVDASELLVSDEMWPLPKYREMLLAHNLT